MVINVFSLGNPTPLANEGGIYHPHSRGRCREDSNPSAWEQFTFFSLIVPEKCDICEEKHSSRKILEADTTTSNERRFNIETNRSVPESITYCKLGTLKVEKSQQTILYCYTLHYYSCSAWTGMKACDRGMLK